MCGVDPTAAVEHELTNGRFAASRKRSLMSLKPLYIILIVLGYCGLFASPAQAQQAKPMSNCERMATLDFAGLPDAATAIASAETVAAAPGVSSYCKISGTIAPQIQFELRLPADWNGRYLQGGCGGFCGFNPIENCRVGQSRGFAVAASNLGHIGGVWVAPVWAGDPMLRRDFGGRATHVLAVAAKAMIAAYYGNGPRYSYFQGCSTGGREGLQIAQNHPTDFDGVIAGDPAFAGRLGGIWNNWIAATLMGRDNEPVFDAQSLKVLHAAVNAACDTKDGLKDGIIEDSRRCSFDPVQIECRTQDTSNCLTKAQVTAARAMYDGARNSAGKLLYPGAAPRGSELDWNGPLMAEVTRQSLRFLAFPTPRPTYNFRDFNWDRDVADTEAATTTYDPVAPRAAPDLAAFHARGGRLIAYHGSYDYAVPPDALIDYYAQVWNREGGLTSTRDWFRLFIVPGMFHCRGGDAPNEFDMLAAIVDWVEHGRAPDGIVATQHDKAGTLVRTRPLYAYPNVARYVGHGDVNEAANWAMKTVAVGEDRADWIWKPTDRN